LSTTYRVPDASLATPRTVPSFVAGAASGSHGTVAGGPESEVDDAPEPELVELQATRTAAVAHHEKGCNGEERTTTGP
jgi:hypothetical protein